MTLERWKQFSKRQQLLFVGSELERARVWQKEDEEKFKGALERGIELVDLMILDQQWKDGLPMILKLREEMAKFHAGGNKTDIKALYQAL